MFLLIVSGICLLAILVILAVTQIWIPAALGLKLFPSFRSDPLRDEVEMTAAEVEQLKEQNKNLQELAVLKAQKEILQNAVKATTTKKD